MRVLGVIACFLVAAGCGDSGDGPCVGPACPGPDAAVEDAGPLDAADAETLDVGTSTTTSVFDAGVVDTGILTCGNGILEADEACDDGNVETEACAYGLLDCLVCGTECTLVPGAAHYCGDDVLDAEEGCEDGNVGVESCAYGEDGCSVCGPTCTLVPGILQVCGDGTVDAPDETCDDGNALVEACAYGVEACTVCGETCADAPGLVSVCGDGVVDTDNGEDCDDGNVATERCAYGDVECSVCTADCTTGPGIPINCGDGVVDDDTGETCDDGNILVDACSYGEESCTVCGVICIETAGVVSYCGDGQVDATNDETCDDGNAVTETCEYGEQSCTVCTDACVEADGATQRCGDGVVQLDQGEDCDDSNAVTESCEYDDDSCSVCTETCELGAGITRFCGDGVIEAGEEEECDDGNAVTDVCSYGVQSCMICNSDCESEFGATSYFGDGFTDVAQGEQCEVDTEGCVNGGSSNILTVSGGTDHSCVLMTGGEVACWGLASSGQGSVDGIQRGDEPGELGAALPAIVFEMGLLPESLFSGDSHNCAVMDDATMRCWGDNANGVLGQGTGDDVVMSEIENLSAIDIVDETMTNRSVIAGGTSASNACATLGDATVHCWGEDSEVLGPAFGAGDVGDEALELGNALAALPLGTPVTSVGVGDGFGCATSDNGRVKCWGVSPQVGSDGSDAHLGSDPEELGEALPFVDLGSVSTGVDGGVRALRVAETFSCVLFVDGTVKCWGANNFGQLGIGSTAAVGSNPDEMGDNLPAVDFGDGAAAIDLSVGASHACVILSDRTVRCWGANGFGQLGLGDTEARGDEPGEMGDALAVVNLGAPALAVHAFWSHTCAILQGGSVKCWGANASGQLGLGDIRDRGDEPNEMGINLPVIQF